MFLNAPSLFSFRKFEALCKPYLACCAMYFFGLFWLENNIIYIGFLRIGEACSREGMVTWEVYILTHLTQMLRMYGLFAYMKGETWVRSMGHLTCTYSHSTEHLWLTQAKFITPRFLKVIGNLGSGIIETHEKPIPYKNPNPSHLSGIFRHPIPSKKDISGGRPGFLGIVCYNP